MTEVPPSLSQWCEQLYEEAWSEFQGTIVCRFFKFCGLATFAIGTLVLWEMFMALAFVLALILNSLMYLFWLPYLAAKSWHLQRRWRTPYYWTWNNERYLGSPYNPHNTFRANAQVLFLEAAGNIWWRIKNDYRTLLG